MSKRIAEFLIVALSVGSVSVMITADIVESRVRNQIATNCVAQSGEALESVHQSSDGVVCVYAQFPMRAKTQRKAT